MQRRREHPAMDRDDAAHGRHGVVGSGDPRNAQGQRTPVLHQADRPREDDREVGRRVQSVRGEHAIQMTTTKITKIILVGLWTVSVGAVSARADVVRVEISRSVDIQGSDYEKIAGTMHFAVNPADPHNAVIVDLDKAPRNAAGLVEFSADFYLLRPKDPARSNGSALVEVSNRGGRGLLRQFNRGGPQSDPETDAELGDKFLMRFGFTAGWIGWEFDVADTPATLRIHVPIATDGGKTISGIVRAAFIPGSRVNEFV